MNTTSKSKFEEVLYGSGWKLLLEETSMDNGDRWGLWWVPGTTLWTVAQTFVDPAIYDNWLCFIATEENVAWAEHNGFSIHGESSPGTQILLRFDEAADFMILLAIWQREKFYHVEPSQRFEITLPWWINASLYPDDLAAFTAKLDYVVPEELKQYLQW